MHDHSPKPPLSIEPKYPHTFILLIPYTHHIPPFILPYTQRTHFISQPLTLFTPEMPLMTFLKTHAAASDIPNISPPNAGLSAVCAPLTKQNALSLLDWIHNP